MAGSSNFVVFNPPLNNAETDTEYAADTVVTNGLVAGLATSVMHNKLFHQVSIMAAAIGNFIVNMGGTASDADVSALTTAFTDAVNPNPLQRLEYWI